MSEKIIAFIASVKEREQQLKIVIERLYDQVDLIHLVLNYYEEVPEWIGDVDGDAKIFAHLNQRNKNSHDSVWQYVDAENAATKINNEEKYYFICDDDLFYPKDYVFKMIEAIERHGKQTVVTVHGSNIDLPVESYFQCRDTYGFSVRLNIDLCTDMAGVGTTAFHSSAAIKPTLQDFPVVFCRDLFFSILCAKNNVRIVSLQRPQDWIRPLATPGDTVYDATRRNANLLRIKNSILKEQLLPLLFCKKENDKYCLITDYDFDARLLNNTLGTLKNVSNCNRIVFSNKVVDYGPDILTQYVIPEEVEIGQMGSKVVTQYRFINGLPNDSKVISADADLYFLKDPFTAFERDFDIAVTTRPEKYHYPINGGVVMLRVNERVKDLLDYLMSQVFNRTWPELIDYQKQFNHEGNDWYIDQDLWCIVWLYREDIRRRFGLKIIDIGPEYNYCPHADGADVDVRLGKDKLMRAYNAKAVSVLHLKSRLRELLLDGGDKMKERAFVISAFGDRSKQVTRLVKNIRQYFDYPIHIITTKDSNLYELEGLCQYQNLEGIHKEFVEQLWPDHPRSGQRNGDYWPIAFALDHHYKSLCLLDDDMFIANENFIDGFTIAEHFGVAVPLNPRVYVKYDAMGADVQHKDLVDIKEMPQCAPACNFSPMFVYPYAGYTNNFLRQLKIELRINYCRGPLAIWKASWKSQFTPVYLPEQYCVCASNAEHIKNYKEQLRGQQMPIPVMCLHLGHEKVREVFKDVIE